MDSSELSLQILVRSIFLRTSWTGVAGSHNKELDPIIETTQLEVFRQQQKLDWTSHVIRTEKGDNQDVVLYDLTQKVSTFPNINGINNNS